MAMDHNQKMIGITDIFPDQIKVYDLGKIKYSAAAASHSLLNRHFKDPPSVEILDQLV